MHGAGGGRPAIHGRYSKVKREQLRSLIEEHEADPDPLNIFPELAAARALFQDFIERYDEFIEALVAWHHYFQAIKGSAADCMRAIDDYEELLGDEELPEFREKMLEGARKFVNSFIAAQEHKPTQVLDISDAYRVVSEITKIVERIEKLRNANAISRPDLMRVMTEMARVVQANIDDQPTLDKIKNGWLGIRLG
jgi:molecular chaperone DnaK (HSP70)